MELPKAYDASQVESKIYKLWLDGGYFHAEPDSERKPFTIVIPPPNVTGQLHMGHALDETLQDILIRFRRMQGYNALWMPGTDHAGIATQIKVEEDLRVNEGLSRHDIGREQFLERVWAWKEKHGGRIIEQLKALGSSCDWERLRFTMDEGCSKAVIEVFVSLYEKGLIYRGERIINWCPKCGTALSDTEVEHTEHASKLWHIRYDGVDGGSITVATTRPETCLGDMAVAVHPDDERYKSMIGKKVRLPLTDRVIPVIADEYVDPSFGTGCVKITPSHDPNDFEVAARHGIGGMVVLDGKAHINENGGCYKGLSREEAREAMLRDFGEHLVKTVEHNHNVGHCHRCDTVVEPLASKQWFVRMKPLAEPALEAVREGKIKFVPERFEKIYNNWMENVRDWCVSRQLWWGHAIPAYYCDACGHMEVSRTKPQSCPECGGAMSQDGDVLDTWFSSALWPFSTLGWPEKTAELEHFYPTSVLVTAYDIIFFWVARMIFSGLEHTGQAPFDTVYIHGLLRDSQGRKMSKSLGNGVDPIEIIARYGADALRFTLVTGVSPGNDSRFQPERLEAMRNFCNKLWNASRFAMMNMKPESWQLPETLMLEDKWILTKLNALIPEVTANLEKYELGVAATKLYDFVWDDLCDWYIELIKPRLQSGTEESRGTAEQVLCFVLETALKLLHPYMPHITEEIWQALPREGHFVAGKETPAALMVSVWPQYDRRFEFREEAFEMEILMDAVRAIRARRAEMNVPPSRKAALIIQTDKVSVFTGGKVFLQKLASAAEVSVYSETPDKLDSFVCVVTDDAKLYMPLSELVDLEAERERAGRELKKAQDELRVLESKLANDGFIRKAPAQVVASERERASKLKERIERLIESTKK